MVVLTLIVFDQKKKILKNIFKAPELKKEFDDSLGLSPEKMEIYLESNEEMSQNFILSQFKPNDSSSIPFSKLKGK
jgi:hypothetical protein